jgi:hypothetical protein
VAGKPTLTTAMPRSSIRRLKYLERLRLRFIIVYLELNGAFWANCTIFIRGKVREKQHVYEVFFPLFIFYFESP